MLSFGDITYCSCGCQNINCDINVLHLRDKQLPLPVSMANRKCDNYKHYYDDNHTDHLNEYPSYGGVS